MLRRVPRTAWVCAAVAVANCAIWSILIPPLQGADEQAHFAYVQQLVENGKLPNGSSEENFSPEELAAMRDLEFGETILNPGTDAVPSRARREQLVHDLSQPLSRKGDGSVGVAASEPPLYYALQTIPYELGSSSSLLTRLALMRLLSALLTGITALFVFLFIREALPAVPWAWTVGGLGVALSPLLAFDGGSLNPDTLLFGVCAALFYCLARAFRRGFEPRLAAALGAVVTTGLLTKVNFLALIPGTAVGLILLTVRTAQVSRRQAYRSLALACSGPVVLYALTQLTRHKEPLSVVLGPIEVVKRHGLSAEFSYIWQFYLPRLPGMPSDFPGITPALNIWFKGLIGRYNWLETVFPGWVYTVALIPAGAIAGLCVRELYAGREALRKRRSELAAYGSMLLGLMVLLPAASFESFPTLAAGDSEPRYFLPMLALGGALLALAARGGGRRWGPVAGVAIVMLIFGHDVLSQLLEVSRYYHPL
jgi:4-amino-4-deoxy-L-arabinose transferase-like glycosyltransferase